jgi:hypothetical protein
VAPAPWWARSPGAGSAYRHAVASETPNPAPTCANVSFLRRWARTSRACLTHSSSFGSAAGARKGAGGNENTLLTHCSAAAPKGVPGKREPCSMLRNSCFRT